MEQIVKVMEDNIKKLKEVKDKMDTNRRNEAIAEFMGLKFSDLFSGILPDHWVDEKYELVGSYLDPELKYNTSWDWLMPVVEKIETSENGRYLIEISNREVIIWDYLEYPEKNILQVDRYDSEPKIELVFEAVSDYCLTLKSKP